MESGVGDREKVGVRKQEVILLFRLFANVVVLVGFGGLHGMTLEEDPLFGISGQSAVVPAASDTGYSETL